MPAYTLSTQILKNGCSTIQLYEDFQFSSFELKKVICFSLIFILIYRKKKYFEDQRKLEDLIQETIIKLKKKKMFTTYNY